VAKKNVNDVCKLCHRKRVLCRSHYLGAALFRLCREAGENPVVMTPQLVTMSPRQMWAHLLCQECEKRFCDLGERPTMQLLNGKEGFRLLNLMTLAHPFRRDETGRTIIYSGSDMGIDTAPLAYFALSLLWRGAVHQWKTLKGQTTSVSLGEYEETIRRYLLGETDFPDDVYVAVGVCLDVGSQNSIFPPHEIRGSKFHSFSMLARGLWFDVITERGIKDRVSNLCCIRSHKKVLHATSCHRRFLHAGQFITKTAKVAANLAG
jgi:hypothetical protein